MPIGGNRTQLVATVALIASMVIWSASGIAIKQAMVVLPPLTMIILRFTPSVFLMFVIGILCRRSELFRLQRIDVRDLPLFLIAAVLALTTSRQITTAGALPAWMSSMAEDPEFSSALSAYVVGQSIGVTDILRVLIRMELLPWVNLIGSENSGALLIMERLSPVLVLIPGLCYGWGYTRGVNERSRVHTSIAAGNRRRARKEAKARKARAASTPKQLN